MSLDKNANATLGAGFNVFGELASQASRLAPDGVMDPAVGQLVAAGLASAATLLTASLMRSAYKCAPGAAAHCQGVHDVSRGFKRVLVPVRADVLHGAQTSSRSHLCGHWRQQRMIYLRRHYLDQYHRLSAYSSPWSHTPPAQALLHAQQAAHSLTGVPRP